MTMGETNKQVRVDNWGVFFLQRLQVFFNKTDYCDLTLQFEGNVQLKVHRLVMSACTDYFSILEHTCEIIDGNTIIMPDDLQADVILPIVNFMYTGMLEFPMSIFDKLYRTAELMNIPILIKLLDAQRKPLKGVRKQQGAKKPASNVKEPDLPSMLPGRKLPVWKRKSVGGGTPELRTMSPQLFSTPVAEPPPKRTLPDPLALYDNTPKPTRFEWPEEELNTFNLIDSPFNDITYSSKPLLTQDDELRASTSFDELKYSGSGRRSKDFDANDADAQKVRSDLAEFEEEDEDDPDNYLIKRQNKRKLAKESSPTHTKKVRFTISEKENKEMTISVTPKNPGDMDHTKIISEVLKRYPHLVKKNKNIKLKIMAKSPVKEPAKLPSIIKPPPALTKVKVLSPKESPKPLKAVTTKVVKPQADEGPWVCKKCSYSSTEPVEFVLYYLYRKHMTDVHHETFDSRMCKHCGHQSSKHNLLMYHQYTKHGVKPPPAYNFPKCARCPFVALTERLLQKHLHGVHSKFDLQCSACKVAFNSQESLLAHVQITGHSNSGRSSFDCQYCTKHYNSAGDLFSHIRASHRDEARRDGMVSIDETGDMDEDQEEGDEEEDVEEFVAHEERAPQPKKLKNIEVVSNVKISDVSKFGSAVQQRPEPADIMTNVEAGNQGIVDIVVLDENQQYILHNDHQLVHAQRDFVHEQPEYILPQIIGQHEYAPAQSIGEVVTTGQAGVITQSMLHNSEIASTDELVMVLTDHDYNDANNEILTNENSNIVVLYSHPVDGQQNEFITSEGKLILNSQTGLLELQNESTDSQDSQIESIELIQREINNGLIQQNMAENRENPQVSMASGGSYSNLPNQENAAIAKVEESDDKSAILEEVVLPQYELSENVAEEVGQKVQISESVTEEPMEIDETCNIQENDVNEISEMTQMETDQEVLSEEVIRLQEPEEFISKPTESESVDDREKIAENLLEAEIAGNERIEDVSEENPRSDVAQELLMHEEIAMINRDSNVGADSDATSEVTPEINPPIPSEMHHHETVAEVIPDVPSEAQEITSEPHEITSGNCPANPEVSCDTNEHINPEIITRISPELPQEAPSNDCDPHPEMNVPSEIPREIKPEDTKEMPSETNPETSCEINSEIPQSAALDVVLMETQRTEATDFTETPEISEQNEGATEHIGNLPETTTETLQLPVTAHEDSCRDFLMEDPPISDIISEETTTQNQMETTPPTLLTTEDSEQTNFCADISEIVNIPGNTQDTPETAQDPQNPMPAEENQIPQGDLTDQAAVPEISNVPTEGGNGVCKQLPDELSTEDYEHADAEKGSIVAPPPPGYESAKGPLDTETEGSVEDENSRSQDSQTSQELVSDSDKPAKSAPNEATKISILNDWEDTEDSQQSDNPAKGIESTVNKLIDDWDDDDDEGT